MLAPLCLTMATLANNVYKVYANVDQLGFGALKFASIKGAICKNFCLKPECVEMLTS